MGDLQAMKETPVWFCIHLQLQLRLMSCFPVCWKARTSCSEDIPRCSWGADFLGATSERVVDLEHPESQAYNCTIIFEAGMHFMRQPQKWGQQMNGKSVFFFISSSEIFPRADLTFVWSMQTANILCLRKRLFTSIFPPDLLWKS